MGRPGHEAQSQQIIDVVLELLELEGYDAVQLREVARRGHVSLATIYKWFPTRDELIVAAVQHWMAVHTYSAVRPGDPTDSLREGMMQLLRVVFGPWERNPKMLAAYYRARNSAAGHRLDAQGIDAIMPVVAELVRGGDARYVEDVGLVMANMTFALIGRFVDGGLAITEILPILDRVLYRMTSDNAVLAEGTRHGPGRGTPIASSVAAPFDRR